MQEIIGGVKFFDEGYICLTNLDGIVFNSPSAFGLGKDDKIFKFYDDSITNDPANNANITGFNKET